MKHSTRLRISKVLLYLFVWALLLLAIAVIYRGDRSRDPKNAKAKKSLAEISFLPSNRSNRPTVIQQTQVYQGFQEVSVPVPRLETVGSSWTDIKSNRFQPGWTLKGLSVAESWTVGPVGQHSW